MSAVSIGPRRLLAIALALVGGCQSPTEPVRDGPLSVTARRGVLVIENTGSAPLHSFAITREASELADLIFCNDPARCPGLAPGARKKVSYSEIYGYVKATRDVVVYGWHLVPSGNGFTPDRIRSVIVRL
jgi:hypothetical protein